VLRPPRDPFVPAAGSIPEAASVSSTPTPVSFEQRASRSIVQLPHAASDAPTVRPQSEPVPTHTSTRRARPATPAADTRQKDLDQDERFGDSKKETELAHAPRLEPVAPIEELPESPGQKSNFREERSELDAPLKHGARLGLEQPVMREASS